MSDGEIIVGNRSVGRVQVEPTQMRGEGGVLSPALVLPVRVQLEPQEEGRQVVVTEVRADLALGTGPAQPGSHLGENVRARGIGGERGVWASGPQATRTYGADLRFGLGPLQVRLLEEAASQATPGLNLIAHFEIDLAWLRQEQPNVLGHGSIGALDLLPLPLVRAVEVTLLVPRSDWADRILPGLGHDAIRLVAVRLPRAGGPLGDDLVGWFDQARRKFDGGDYRGAIERARDVRNAIEKRMHATKGDPVATKVGDTRGLPEDAGQTAFLDGVWRALAQATNEAHHAESPHQIFTAADARVVLLTTAVVLEYLGAIAPGPL